VYIWVAERGCRVSALAPTSASRGPHLHRHGQVDRLDDRLHDRARAIRVLQHRRPGARLRHLAHRAAEVEVDEVCPGRLDHPRGLGHRARIRAEELDRERVLVGGDPQVAERPLVAVLDAGAADHLGADEPGPEAAALASKGLHADARHRRQHEAGRDLHGADRPRRAQVELLHRLNGRGGPEARRRGGLHGVRVDG
jgi:hypothetical protein